MTTEKKVLIVIAPRKFRDEELTEPIHYLEKAGIAYEVISTSRGLAIGMLGGKMLIEQTIVGVKEDGIAGYAGILIVGGGGSVEYLWNNTPLLELVHLFDTAGKIVSAICLAPVVLAHAGILNEKKVTVWNDDVAIEEIQKAGGIFTSQPVVVDGRIITANGPTAAAAFGEKVAKAVLAS
ncbi:MAG TPA: DJ-1/PfpI family protein [Methanospirillum sp.]|nr:DJ-1/PfpI family protein [Methanospirillum sp.]